MTGLLDSPVAENSPFDMPGLAWREVAFRHCDVDSLRHRFPDGASLDLQVPADMRGAVPKRRSEFLAGRLCAALALHALGLPPQVGQNGRAPAWPAGAAGSISHSDGLAIAVASRGHDRLGVDCERRMSAQQAAELRRMILTPAEMALRPAAMAEADFVTLVFSGKEALYKAAAAGLTRMPEFHDATLCAIAPGTMRLRLEGRDWPVAWRLRAADCVTLVALPSGPAEAARA